VWREKGTKRKKKVQRRFHRRHAFFLPNRFLFSYSLGLMSVPKLNVADVAGLARLSLTPDETAKFSSQLSQILAHMETLGQIGTGDVPEVTPPAQPALRKDIPTPSLTVEAALSNAPAQSNDLILVPKIVE
jgi:aspartyl-tRNA(Asn)/glutamyl-tRNA(Gln) amidotransferase subunit C